MYLSSVTSTQKEIGGMQDYVEAMWLMLQLDKPLDLVIATEEAILHKRICSKIV